MIGTNKLSSYAARIVGALLLSRPVSTPELEAEIYPSVEEIVVSLVKQELPALCLKAILNDVNAKSETSGAASVSLSDFHPQTQLRDWGNGQAFRLSLGHI